MSREINDFVKGYIVCALWTESLEDNGRTIDDINNGSLLKIIEDCNNFQKQAKNALTASGMDDEHAGHNFWLTRNHHGTGFWDRDLGKIGDELTAIAHKFGECDIYVGDDDQIYI